MVRYKVKFTESERGWGQNLWWNYYDTYAEAKAAIDRSNKENEEEWKRTKTVPDYYIQCEDEIIACDDKET